jgi:hypothetical protein
MACGTSCPQCEDHTVFMDNNSGRIIMKKQNYFCMSVVQMKPICGTARKYIHTYIFITFHGSIS